MTRKSGGASYFEIIFGRCEIKRILRLFEPEIFGLGLVNLALEGGDDAIDMDVRGFDKDLGALLGARGRGAGDEDIGDVRFHGLEADFGFAVIGDKLDAELFEEGLVLLVAGEEEYEVGVDGLSIVEDN